MQRCIQLAQNGLGRTWPNPVVGSVIVHNDRIIGEGWHQKAGEAHAEVNAIKSVQEKEHLAAATIYVSLEPCSHFGKTPPCSDLIIAKGIKKVVIGTIDPFSEVAGKGVKKLLDAGCEVRVGILEAECRALNQRFFTFHTKHRPYIILKWAQSSDGFLAPSPQENAERKPVWITGKYSRQLVHKWRAEEQAIMVGTNTAVADDPKLDTRLWQGSNPVRVVLDRKLRIPVKSHLFDTTVKTIVITENLSAERAAKNVIFEQVDFDRYLVKQINELLYRHELQSVIIEGGRQTLETFLNAEIWDEARVFEGNIRFKGGIKAPEISGKIIYESAVTGDRLKIFKNDKNDHI